MEAAIDGDHRAGGEGEVTGDDGAYCQAYVVRSAPTPLRHQPLREELVVFFFHAGRHVRRHDSGTEFDHLDILLRQSRRPKLCGHRQTRLGDAVVASVDRRSVRRDGRHVDDLESGRQRGRVLTRSPVPHDRLGQKIRSLQIRANEFLERFFRRFRDVGASLWRDARIVHQGIDAAEFLESLGDKPRAIRLRADVRLKGEKCLTAGKRRLSAKSDCFFGGRDIRGKVDRDGAALCGKVHGEPAAEATAGASDKDNGEGHRGGRYERHLTPAEGKRVRTLSLRIRTKSTLVKHPARGLVMVQTWTLGLFRAHFLMRRFRSLLIDRVDVRLPGLHVRTFALHRHLQEHASVEPHRHAWSQALLYLSGNGRQKIAESEASVSPGTLVLIPPGVLHAFVRAQGPAPLCLMIDFQLKGVRQRSPVVCSLNRSELANVREQLAHLTAWHSQNGKPLPWEGAIAILQVLMTLLRAVGWARRIQSQKKDGRARAIEEMLKNVQHDDSLAEVIQRSGYQRDHLNRLVRRETGFTLGQYRAQRRLAEAKELIAQGMRVAEIAAAVGLPDQSYFARWFRRQTGQTPSVWGRQSTR